MTVDYYALLTKAVTGKDTLGRDKIYKDAYDLITRSTHLTREAAAANVAALEAAIRRIEDDIAIEEGRDAAQINEVLSPTGSNWKPWAFGAGALAVAIALAALVYGYVATKGPAIVATSVTRATAESGTRARRRRDGRPQGRRRWRLHRRRPGVLAAAAGGVLPHHRGPRIDRGRPRKPLPLSDRCQQFRAPLRHRHCAGMPQGRQLLPRHQQARMARLALIGGTPGTPTHWPRRPAVPAARSAPARCCWTSPAC